MTKNPSTTWFYNDWENDPALKTCSLAAQGLWMRLLCIAARSPEPGVVQIGSLNFSHPEGLTQIASAAGRSLEEIAPLIDELITSGTASQDRKGRIYNRRMKEAARVSAARAQSGANGAAVTNEKRWGKRKLGHQNLGNEVSKPSPSSSLQSSKFSSHNSQSDFAARATASPDGPPPARLTTAEVWRERLAQFKPWLPDFEARGKWPVTWGPKPDAFTPNPLIDAEDLRWWRAQAAQARREAA